MSAQTAVRVQVTPKVQRLTNVLLMSIVAVAFGLRVVSFDFGLPFAYHMDEVAYDSAVRHAVCEGDFNTSLWQTQTYLFTTGVATTRLMPSNPICSFSPDSFNSLSLLIGRMISVAAGTITVLLVFRLGQMLYSSQAGFVAALLAALNFLHVRESHFGTPDVVAICLALSALVAIADIEVSRKRTVRQYALAAALTMLAINARLTFGLLLLPFACVHMLPVIRAKDYSFRAFKRLVFDRKVWISAGIFIVLFVLTSPQLLIAPMEYFRYWRSFFQLGRLGGFGRFVMDRASAPIFYGEATIWAMGLLQAIALALAGLWALRRRRFNDLLILSFLVPYMLVAAKSNVYFARYAIPVTLLGAVLIARFVTEVISNRYVPLAAAILVIQPLVYNLQFDRLMLQQDTRTLAHDWILANIPQHAKIVEEFHTPFIDDIYDVTQVEIHGSWQNSLESYITDGYDYLIVSSFIRDLPMILPEEQARKVSFYRALDQKAELVKEFRPYSGPVAPPYRIDQILAPLNNLNEFDRPGPTIYIYRLPRIQHE